MEQTWVETVNKGKFAYYPLPTLDNTFCGPALPAHSLLHSPLKWTYLLPCDQALYIQGDSEVTAQPIKAQGREADCWTSLPGDCSLPGG